MRRYRVINANFDSRANVLAYEIRPEWEQSVQEQWRANKAQIVAGVRQEVGEKNLAGKVERLTALGQEPFSLVAYHNMFLRQCRYAYVLGAFYPALTGACALGERILNHLILDLRDDYRDSPHYKKIYDKQSFDNWDKVITILSDWGIASDRALDAFRKLKDRRNAAIHFDPAVDENSAERLACDAVRALQEAVESQFGIFNQPWQIPDAPHTYVAVEAESWPFVKRIVIPSPSVELVGPEARLEFDPGTHSFIVAEIGDAGPAEGSDQKFLDLVPS